MKFGVFLIPIVFANTISIGAEEVLLLPSGVANSEKMIGSVSSSSGGVDTIDLKSGALKWHNSNGDPIAIINSYLITQQSPAGRLQICVASLDQGEEIIKAFPEHLSVSSLVNEERQSLVRAGCAKEGKLIFQWQGSERYTGGAPPSSRILDDVKRGSRGWIIVDLKEKRVAALSSGEGLDCNEVDLPIADAGSRVRSASYWTGYEWSTQPFRHGKHSYVFEKAQADDNNGILLRSTDESASQLGKKLADKSSATVHLTLNHRFVLVRESAATDIEAIKIFSVQSGKQVAGFKANAKTWQAAAVIGDRMVVSTKTEETLHRTTRALIGLELNSGKIVWERPLPDIVMSAPRLRP